MSFWGRLFGTDKAASSLIDNVAKGLDALVYTDEEKAQDAAKSRSEARAMIIEWNKNTQGQNLARRIIALLVTAVWLAQYITMQILGVASVWASGEVSQKMVESAKIIGEFATSMNGAMMLILGFYFAAPHMGKIAESALNKFGNRG